MPLRSNEFAARDSARIEFRSDPLRVRVESSRLVSADQHDLRCVFEFSARVGDHAADRQLFAEMLMTDRSVIAREDVALHFQPALESCAESAASEPVATLLSEIGKSMLIDAFRKALDASAFNSGLIILPPFQLEISSPSLARQQRETAQRARIEEQAAVRLDHLRRAADLLKQFDSIRAAAPSISAGQVLERIAPADRGAMLTALLAGNNDRVPEQTLYSVGGSQLVKIDFRADTIQPIAIDLPTTLGPLRSIQSAKIDGTQRLLIGARGGVLVVDPREPKSAVAYADGDLNSSLGFNRAIYLPGSNTISATHGEAGVVRWELGNPKEPSGRISSQQLDAGPVRNLQAIDRNAAVCSAGNSVRLLDGAEHRVLWTEVQSPIVNIVPDADRLFVIHEDGSIATINGESREVIRRDHRGGPISAAGGLPWLDGLRLLLACDSGAVDCIGPDDSLVTRYNSVYRGFRNITASSNCVAAVSPDRQRLILWNSWDGRGPSHDLHLISLTRHRIADIAFA
jgi:hypothetical protein